MTVTFSDSPISAKNLASFSWCTISRSTRARVGWMSRRVRFTSVVIVPRTVERDDNGAPREFAINQLGDLLKLEEAEVELHVEHVCVGEPEFILKLGESGSIGSSRSG